MSSTSQSLPISKTDQQISLPNSTVVFILGVFSLVLCIIGFVMGTIAFVLGNNDKKLYAKNPNLYTLSSYNLLKWGQICAIIGIILNSLVIFFYMLYIIVFLIIFVVLFFQGSIDYFSIEI